MFSLVVFGKKAKVLSLRGGLATFFVLVADGIFDVQKMAEKSCF